MDFVENFGAALWAFRYTFLILAFCVAGALLLAASESAEDFAEGEE